MAWDQVESQGTANTMKTEKEDDIQIQMPGCEAWIPVNKNQVKRVFSDDLGGSLLLILDEVAELLTPCGNKSEAGREEDEMKSECVMLIQSITQLGRSAGIHMLLATQRNDTKIIPGVIQNNPVSIDTKIRVLRKG